MARSEENHAMLAIFIMHMRVQSDGRSPQLVDAPLGGEIGVEVRRAPCSGRRGASPFIRARTARLAGPEIPASTASMTPREHRRRRERVAPARGWRRVLDLMRLRAEDEDIVSADVLADFDIRAIKGADRQRAIERRTSCCRCRTPPSRGRDLLDRSAAGMIASARLTL
jgi:hypothetical protein